MATYFSDGEVCRGTGTRPSLPHLPKLRYVSGYSSYDERKLSKPAQAFMAEDELLLYQSDLKAWHKVRRRKAYLLASERAPPSNM